MTFAVAEDLKQSLTDKYVVVQEGIAELRRFAGLTGYVKTVNMSGRALVQFDGPVDIGWYDIDPAYLTVVDKPQPKKASGHEKPAAKTPAAAATDKPAAAKGGSPLDMIRKQGAGKPAAAPAAGAAKASPLDMIRKQGAAKTEAPAAAEKPVATPAETAPPPEAATAPAAPAKPPAGMSPLDMIRKQGAAKR